MIRWIRNPWAWVIAVWLPALLLLSVYVSPAFCVAALLGFPLGWKLSEWEDNH